MSVDKNVPQIRFKGFSGGWEDKELGEITLKIGSGKTPKGGDSTYVLEGVPLIRSQNIYDNLVNLNNVAYITPQTHEEMKNSSVFQHDVLLNITGASIGRSAVYTFSTQANVNQHVCIIRLKRGYNSAFAQLHLVSSKGQQLIDNNQAGGAREGLNFQQIGKMQFSFSSAEEQTQIGNYFQKLDNLINQHQQKHDKLSSIKKAMLEKMFPKQGETVPEIRFKGFGGEWSECELKSLCDSFSYGLNASAIKFDGVNKYLRITDINDKSRCFDYASLTSPNADLSKSDEYLLKNGDILFARTGASVGKTYLYNEQDGKVYFAGFLIRASINDKASPQFIFQNTQTKAYDKFVATTSQRSGQPGINAKEYSEYRLFSPEGKEQTKIGNYFQKLDTLINQHQQQITKLNNIKQACLSKMFV